MADSYAIRAILSAVDNLSPVLQKVEGSVQQFGSRVEANYGAVGKAMVGVGAATTAMGVTSLKSFGQFQQSLNTAAVVAGGTAKDINGLADVANKMGADLPISAQQASDAMVEMARNGASVGQIKEQFPAIAQAATAAGSNLQATAGVVQQAMNIWGDSLKSPSQAAEILVQTANMSNASIEDMQQALATIGGTAKLAGMSLADTSEAIGLLTNKGFSAAQASDDLNHAILQMMAPSKVAQGTMNDLGLSFVDASGKMKPFPQILQEVADSMDGLSKSEQTAALKSMFGTAGMQAIAPLLDTIKNKTNDSANSWDAWSKKVDSAAGTSGKASKQLQDQANEMQKNVGAKIEQLGGNWEALRNNAMNSTNGVSSGLLNAMNSTLEWAGSSHNAVAKVIRGFVGLSPVIGPVVTAIGGFLTSAGRIATVGIQAAKGLFAMVKGAVSLAAKLLPIGSRGKSAGAGLDETSKSSRRAGKASSMSTGQILAMGAAIMMAAVGAAILVASFALLVSQVTKLAKVGPMGAIAFLAVAAGMSAVIGVMGIVGKMLGDMGPKAAIAYAGMALLVGAFALLTYAVTGLAQTGKQGTDALTKLTIAIVGIVAVMGIFAPVFQACIPGLLAFGAAIIMVGVGVAIAATGLALLVVAFTGLVNAISGLASQGPVAIGVIIALTAGIAAMVVVLAVFGPLLTISAVGLLAFGAALLMAGVGIGIAAAGIAMLVNAISNLLSTNTVLGQIISDVWNGIKTVISGVANTVGPIVSAGFGAMKGIATGIMNALKGVISGVWNAIKGFFQAGVNFIKSVMHVDLSGNGRSIMQSLWDGMKSIWEGIKGFVSGIAGWIKAHKGPISYDRKLLIPAGQAIMTGFNRGLTDGFSTVQDNVLSMASAIQQAATLPALNDNEFMRSVNAVQNRMQNMSASVDGTLTADNAGMTNLSSRLWRTRMEELVGVAVDKLDNVDQHPMIGLDTANRLNDYNNKINAQNLIMWKE